MKLPQSTIERIKKDAAADSQIFGEELAEFGLRTDNSVRYYENGYENGATAEASRSQLLVEALEKVRELAIKDDTYMYSINKIVTEALKQHAEPLKDNP